MIGSPSPTNSSNAETPAPIRAFSTLDRSGPTTSRNDRLARGIIGGGRLPPLLLFAIAAKAIAAAVWFFSTQRAVALVSFFLPDPFVLYALFVPSAQAICRTATHFTTDRPAIWLTIDDGPDEHDTPQILDLLDRFDAKATFFVIGERAEHWPHLVREIVRRGHTIGHHTHTHPAGTLWCATPRRLGRELDATLHALEQIQVRPKWFRPPVGIKNLLLERALAGRNMDCVGWTVRSGDCHSDSPERLVTKLAPRLKPGAIVLMHEGPSVRPAVRVKALALLLEALANRKLKCELPDARQLR